MPKRAKEEHVEPFHGRSNAGAMRMHVSPDDHRYPDMVGPTDIEPTGFSRGRGKRRAGNRAQASAVGKKATDGKQTRSDKKKGLKKKSRG